MVESKYSDLNPADTTICELQQQPAGTETHFWYADAEDDSGEGCSGSAITDKLTGELSGQKIASGKLLKATDTNTPKEGSITSSTKGEEYNQEVDLSQRTINTTTGHDTKYYYLLVKYPNESSTDQSKTDAKKEISVKLTIEGEPTAEVYTLYFLKKCSSPNR